MRQVPAAVADWWVEANGRDQQEKHHEHAVEARGRRRMDELLHHAMGDTRFSVVDAVVGDLISLIDFHEVSS